MASIEKYIWPSENDLWTIKDDTWYGKFVESRSTTVQETFYRTETRGSTGWEEVDLSLLKWINNAASKPNKNRSYIRSEPKDLGDDIAECDLGILYGGEA